VNTRSLPRHRPPSRTVARRKESGTWSNEGRLCNVGRETGVILAVGFDDLTRGFKKRGAHWRSCAPAPEEGVAGANPLSPVQAGGQEMILNDLIGDAGSTECLNIDDLAGRERRCMGSGLAAENINVERDDGGDR